MPSLFDISVSGLFSSQVALDTTANNIANASTEGYSRQRVSQTPNISQFVGGVYIGTGVEVSQVKRLFDQSHQIEIQAASASLNKLEAFSQASRVDGLLADSQNGLNVSVQSFFTSLQDVVNAPASIPARQVFFDQAQGLVSRFKSIHSQLDAQVNQVNRNIDSVANEITILGESIARLNSQIVGSTGLPPSDLLDKRDLAVSKLSEFITVQTIEQKDGSQNVFIGSGQSLVIGSISNQLIASSDPQNPRAKRLSLVSGNSSVDITSTLTGGRLGGLISVVKEIIEPAFNTLGRIAISIADSFNQQSKLGMDLNNNLGGNLFIDINDSNIANSRISSNANNTGSADVNITIDDPALLTDSNYTLLFQSGTYQLVDQTTNTTIASFAPPGALPGTVQIPSIGISINFQSGAAISGDSFDIQPVRNFSRDLKLLISSAEQVAGASPLRGEKSQSNIGSGEITKLMVSDTSTVQFTATTNDLSPPLRIQFDAGGITFSLIDISTGVALASGIGGFVAGQDNDMLALAGAPFDSYGYEISLNGDPQAGDSFDINYNNNGFGNNENAVLLGSLQQLATLDNGRSNFQQAFGRIISLVGTKTQSAQIQKNAAESILFQAKERRESLSGVNLDEEAANLLKFQKAYEASAQVINVARTLFQTVLNAVR